MPASSINANKILETALTLAEKRSWDELHLHHIAAKLKTDISTIRKYYRDKNDLSRAWFEQANADMLKEAKKAGFKKLKTRDKLHTLMISWLNHTAKHRRISRQMLYARLYPGQCHHALAGYLRSKQTTEWMYEACQRETSGCKRALELCALNKIFLATVAYWFHDESKAHKDTDRFLKTLLKKAERLAHFQASKKATR